MECLQSPRGGGGGVGGGGGGVLGARPGTGALVPGWQGVQVAVAGPAKLPWGHCAHALDDALENVPAEQAEQAVEDGPLK